MLYNIQLLKILNWAFSVGLTVYYFKRIFQIFADLKFCHLSHKLIFIILFELTDNLCTDIAIYSPQCSWKCNQLSTLFLTVQSNIHAVPDSAIQSLHCPRQCNTISTLFQTEQFNLHAVSKLSQTVQYNLCIFPESAIQSPRCSRQSNVISTLSRTVHFILHAIPDSAKQSVHCPNITNYSDRLFGQTGGGRINNDESSGLCDTYTTHTIQPNREGYHLSLHQPPHILLPNLSHHIRSFTSPANLYLVMFFTYKKCRCI